MAGFQLNLDKDSLDAKRRLYTAPLTDKDSAMNRFLRGWDDYLSGTGNLKEGAGITWQGLGAHHASLEGACSMDQRRTIFIRLLEEFLYQSEKTKNWSDLDRQKAMDHARSTVIQI